MPALGVGLALVVAILMTAITFETRRDLERTEDVLAALLQSDGMRMEGEGDAVAQFVPVEGGAALIVAGLPATALDETYQLWYLGGDAPVSAGTFDAGDDLSVVDVNADFEGFEGAAVTIEPAGGSDQPTTDPVLASI
jgi:anti-sigma-K factor RskA